MVANQVISFRKVRSLKGAAARDAFIRLSQGQSDLTFGKSCRLHESNPPSVMRCECNGIFLIKNGQKFVEGNSTRNSQILGNRKRLIGTRSLDSAICGAIDIRLRFKFRGGRGWPALLIGSGGITFYQVQWAAFGLIKHSAQILPQHPNGD
jgi:hypothetical protein